MLWVSQCTRNCGSRRAQVFCMPCILPASSPWISLISSGTVPDAYESCPWSPASSGMPWRSQLGDCAWDCPPWGLSLKGKTTPLGGEGHGSYATVYSRREQFMACVIFPRLCIGSTKKKKAKLRDDWKKKYPSQLWELLLQLSDGNAFNFSVNFTSHGKILFYLLA